MENKRFRHFKNTDYELFFDTLTGFEILKGAGRKKDPFSLILPSLLDIGIMGTCKNKCRFCYQGHENRPNMKLEDFKWIIDHVSYHTNQVALGGRGDPNHHPQFKEILEYCREKNIVPNYTTSGIEITDEQIEISKLCGAVAVSDYSREYTFSAIKKFMDAGIKTNIHLIFSAVTFNKSIRILSGIDVWNGQVDIDRLNAVIFLLFKPQGAGRNWKASIPGPKQLRAMSKKILNSKSKFKIGIDSCLANHLVKYEKLNPTQALSIQTCEASRMSSYISPSMNMIPCSFASEKQFGVNLRKNDIEKVWNQSDSFIKFRRKLLYNGNTCPLKL